MVSVPLRVGLSVAAMVAVALASAATVRGQVETPAGTFVVGTVPQRDLERDEGGLIRDAGIESVRVWLDWSEIESKPGIYGWASADEEIREVAGAGLTPLPYLFSTPEWAARLARHDCKGGTCGG